MKLFLISILLFSIISLKTADNEFAVFKGKFVKEQMFKKNGKPLEGVFDYFFQIKHEKYFIKFSNPENGILTEHVDSLLGKKVKILGRLENGLWDTEDPQVQSRVGDYIVVKQILD